MNYASLNKPSPSKERMIALEEHNNDASDEDLQDKSEGEGLSHLKMDLGLII